MKSRTALRLAALAATALVVAACSGGRNGYTPPAPPVNAAPTVTAIGDRSIDQDTVLAIDFGIDDAETAAGGLTVTVAADNTAVFPADGVMLTGSGATRTLTLTPLEAAVGMTNITIRVVDAAGAATTRSFAVAVNAKEASFSALVFDTFPKGENDTATALNGLTIVQDADDPATFAGLIPAEEAPLEP